MRRMRTLLVVLFAVALVATACTGSGDDATDDAGVVSETAAPADVEFAGDSDAAAEEPDRAADAPSAAEGESLGSGGVTPVGVQTDITAGRDIIFTAQVTVSVANVAAAGEQATQIVESLGGFVFGQQTTGAPQPVTTLTFRIAPDRFQEALAQIGGIGELRNQNVSAEDVTGRVVDLQSRIATAETSVERLREFLANATDVNDVAELETQLLERETDLESLRGQLRTVQDRVALATITLTITEAGLAPQVELRTTAYPGVDDAGASCPGNSSIRVEEGSEVTLCFEFINAGDAPLTSFSFTDTVLGIELDDLLVVFGDLEQPLQPGQNAFLAFEAKAERTIRTQSRLRAIPLDADGRPIEAREVSNVQSITVTAQDPGGVPGFGEGVSASLGFLRSVVELVVLVAGVLLPFIWLLPIGWWLWRRRSQQSTRRRTGRRRADAVAVTTTSDAGDAPDLAAPADDAGADSGQ